MHWWLDIEELDGTKAGPGPLRSAISFEIIRRLDAAGKFKAKASLADGRAGMVQAKRQARCWGMLDGVVTDFGAGIIDKIGIDDDLNLDLAGDDLLRELTYRQVGPLTIGAEGAPATTGPAQIAALFPSGWSLDVVSGHNATLKAIYHVYEGESCLAALCKLAEIAGEHFRLGIGRTVIWMQTDRPVSGLRVILDGDPVSLRSNTGVCVATDIQEDTDSYDCLVGRVYAFGVGIGNARITLDGVTTGVTGWTVGSDSKGFYLEHTVTWNTYGIERYTSFKDISDATTLLDIAYEWMVRRLALQKAYKISVAKLDQIIAVGSSIRVIYKRILDGVTVVNIDADLVVLETTTKLDSDGLRTVALKVGTTDVWPDNAASASVSGMNNSRDSYSYPQPVELIGHHARHESGGSDAIKLDDLAVPDANTDLNASASAHGLLPMLSGVSSDVLLGDGTWGAGGGGGVSGSGVANQVALWSDITALSGDAGLTYDPTTDALLSLGTITAKPAGTAGIQLDPNGRTGDYVISLSPGTTILTANRRVSFPNADLTFMSGGSLALSGYTLTVSATGSAAFRNVANTFSQAQIISLAANANAVLTVFDASAVTAFNVSTNMPGVSIGRSFPSVALDVAFKNQVTDAVWPVLQLSHNCSNTPVAGFGVSQLFKAETTTTEDQLIGAITYSWVEIANATRKARGIFYVYDTAAREAIRIEASGSAPMFGVLGAAAARQAHVADPAGGATVDAEARTAINSILASLENFGFHATS